MKEVLDVPTWNRVKAYLGRDLTQYLLAEGDGTESTDLSNHQAEVANLLVEIFRVSELEAWNPLRRWHDISGKICRHLSGVGMSIATHMHLLSGGHPIDPINNEDPVEAALCTLALDVYPLFLIGGRGDGSQFDVMSAMWNHPQQAAAVAAMFQPDEPLMNLFPGADFASDTTAMEFNLTTYVTWSNGAGGTIQLSGIPQAILLRAPGALTAETSPLNSYVASVRDTLRRGRSLAAGNNTTVPAIVGCYSLKFADDLFELPLEGARFRRKTAIDHSLIAESPHEAIILEVDVELHATTPAETDSNKWPSGLPKDTGAGERFHEELQDRINRARLAILLASPEGEVLTAGQSFLSVPNPLSLNGSSGRSPLAWPNAPFQSRPLCASDEEAIRLWHQRLALLPAGMRTGSHRLLSAVNERFNPHDGFIDAVICWENLFGASTETSLRVTGALAWVLHPDDAEARAEFFRATLKIYNDRSALVHGSDKKKITLTRATELRNQSVDIAIRAMRAVMSSERLRGAEDSIDRSKLVLISGER